MKQLAFILCFLLSAVACAPIPYYIGVDVKNESKYSIDINDRNIAVVTVNEHGDRDSALVCEIGMGISEKIESDKNLSQGTIPVYSAVSPFTWIHEAGELDLIAVQTSSDLIIAVDSLKVGEYTIENNDGKSFHDGSFYYTTNVTLPVKFHFSVYDVKSLSFVKKEFVDDSLLWTMLSEEITNVVNATAKANSTLPRLFKGIGNDFAARFSGQWERQDRMIVSFDNSQWNQAYNLAENFKWDEAMNIWLTLVDSSNPIKSSCAAYNLAVACEMQEMYDVALKWLDYAEKTYSFREIADLRQIIAAETN